MMSSDEREVRAAAARQEPFVVAHPCPVCDGRGTIGEQACVDCHGTGVERFFHGTKADLKPGDLIKPGHRANFGNRDRTTTYVYFTGTLDAAVWGAELSRGEGAGRIYMVQPTGQIEDDPNLTDQRFPGNPTRSFRSREPLLVTGEVAEWQGHAAEHLKAMKDGLARLDRDGVEPDDD